MENRDYIINAPGIDIDTVENKITKIPTYLLIFI